MGAQAEMLSARDLQVIFDTERCALQGRIQVPLTVWRRQRLFQEPAEDGLAAPDGALEDLVAYCGAVPKQKVGDLEVFSDGVVEGVMVALGAPVGIGPMVQEELDHTVVVLCNCAPQGTPGVRG